MVSTGEVRAEEIMTPQNQKFGLAQLKCERIW
jgi:hypothetical protein